MLKNRPQIIGILSLLHLFVQEICSVQNFDHGWVTVLGRVRFWFYLWLGLFSLGCNHGGVRARARFRVWFDLGLGLIMALVMHKVMHILDLGYYNSKF